jgi:hypothetical protein
MDRAALIVQMTEMGKMKACLKNRELLSLCQKAKGERLWVHANILSSRVGQLSNLMSESRKRTLQYCG